MNALDYSFWAVQFSLELFGLQYSAKKRIWPLALYLASRAAFDVLTFASRGPFYSYAFWICKPLEYAFLGGMAVYVVGEMLRDAKPLLQITAVILAGCGTGLILLFYVPITATRMLHIEQGVNYVIALFVIGGLFSRQGMRTGEGIAWGLVMLCGIDGTLDALTNGQSRWYALEIAPLCVWAWWAYQFDAAKLREFRRELGQRAEALPKEQAKGAIQ